ncbi:MAG TPA: hypothetical protein VEJ42_00885 [Streptosporangiaceae bacterium]|nr:hypothetical protein [Streptosporangiaceae bacterium]
MSTTADQQAAHASEHELRRAVGRGPWLLAWLALLPVVVVRAGVLAEGDTFWQIRVGLLTLARHAIPATDTFSWTVHGKPYFQNSWGFDLLVAIAYRLGGLPGAAVLCALITLGMIALVLALARKVGASATATALALLLAAPLLVAWLTARPQLFDYAAVPALVLLLRGIERERFRWGAVALTALLAAVWINLHTEALLAVAIAGASAAVLFVLARRDSPWRYAVAATAAAAAGCLANPYGIGVLHQASQVQADSSGLITEWAPFDPASPLQDLIMAAGVAALIIAWRRREAVLLAALAVCMAGSAEAIRFLPLVLILAVPLLAAFVSVPPDPIRRYLTSRRVMFQRCGALGMAAVVVLAAPSLTHIGRPEPSTFPAALVADIPHDCRLFTTDLIGDYVILARPDVLVSLDGRNNLYGPALLVAEERVLHGLGNLSRGLAGAGCVLVPRSYGLAARLRHDAQWKVRAASQFAILYVRR